MGGRTDAGTGKCHALVPYRRGEGAAQHKATGGQDEFVQLRGGLGFLEGADYGKLGVKSSVVATLVANVLWVQTMEVAVARVYNWDVVQKRKEKDEEEKQNDTRKGKDGAPGG